MKYLLLFLLLILAIPILILLYFLTPTSLSSEKITFSIPLDTPQETIVNDLKNKSFIRSQGMFNFLTSLIRYPGSIEPGVYQLSKNMNLYQIADTILNHPYQKWIILVPGLRNEQIAERLGKKFNWDKDKIKEFSDNAREGYMFPDTYLLNVDYSGKEFAQRLISNFNEKFDAKMQKDLLSQDVRTDTMLKIASLIERESGGESDKMLISGIIWNRLNKKMKLQIDATIQYAMGTPSDWWPHVKPQDTKLDSPYNTYQIKALPPGPICNPSLSSIKAAIYPQETECLYYLHSHDKQIHCTVTYQEHLDNIQKYLN
jgi:UPF0755 protein